MDPRLRAAIERQNAAHERRLEAITQLEERIGADVEDTDEARAAAETARTDAQTAFQAAQDEYTAATRDVEQLEQLAAARSQMPRELTREAERTRGAELRVGDEPLTYRRHGEHSFLRDAFLASGMSGMPAGGDVLERLARHQEEHREIVAAAQERAASGTANFVGLVVPQFLTDMVAPLARAGRPVADICNHHDLPPEGMEVDISRITTGTTADVQTEGSAFSSTAIDDTLLTVPVRTVGGFNDISIQAVMRGTGAEQILVQDLIRGYHTKLDDQILNGDGTGVNILGIRSTVGIGAVTFTTPVTAAGNWPKLADAQQRINSAIFANATHIVMAPRRYGWFQAALDSQNRPLLVPSGIAVNAMAVGEGPLSYGNTGYTLMQLPVVTDGNIPLLLGAGTEDVELVVDANELHLWEDPSMPLMMRFEQPVGHQGQVRIVVFGFAAFTAGRYPAATSAITGAGLIAPTF
jgi:HK97 family phage major capsid protein